MQDAVCRMQNVGCRILDVECWMLDIKRMLDVGCRIELNGMLSFPILLCKKKIRVV